VKDKMRLQINDLKEDFLISLSNDEQDDVTGGIAKGDGGGAGAYIPASFATGPSFGKELVDFVSDVDDFF
jgi:hypothetical protein